MQLKTFIAKDMREALVRARREMGDEAVIVTSQRTKEGGVIVRVAAEAREADAKEAQASQPEREAVEFVGNFEQIFFDGMIRRLRSEPQPSAPAAVNFRRSELLRILGRHRVPESLAHRLAEAAEKSGLSDMTLALASALDTRMRTAPLFGDHPNALLLLGPCGAGKTAVAAKIGAHLMRTPRSVKLIATDNAGAGAVARLEAFAQHLDIPCERAACADALPQIVARAAKADALAVADTAGFDPRDGKARAAFAALAQIEGVEPVGVVSAGSDAEEIGEIIDALAAMRCKRVIVTGLDAARRSGALLVAATGKLCLAHITCSPFVSAGLETLTPVSLSRRLIESQIQGSAQ